jgi:hypothetical protein
VRLAPSPERDEPKLPVVSYQLRKPEGFEFTENRQLITDSLLTRDARRHDTSGCVALPVRVPPLGLDLRGREGWVHRQ